MSQKSYDIAAEIFRAYDIRGIVDKTLSSDDAYNIGRAFGTYVRRQTRNKGHTVRVCMGYDGRISSPELSEALSKGLLDSGADVDALGLGPTPMVYFAVKDRLADAGIMVTGSHNPPTHNGFKMMLQDRSVFGEAVQEIAQLIRSQDYETGSGSYKEHDVKPSYIKRLVRDLRPTRPLKIAWDAGNGATAPVLKNFVKELPGEHILLYDQVDGLFPAHHPDPTVDENLKDLQNVVRKQGCDLGIAFDGDGDRIGVVDENGNIIRGDTLLALYAGDVLEKNPGAPVIADVKCSKVLFDEIARLGGKPVICATGHSIVKTRLAELKAPLAGELSGHIFFADKYYGFDDALYCAVRLMNILCENARPLSQMAGNLPVMVNTPEIRIEIDETRKFDVVNDLAKYFKDQFPQAEINDVDGVRVTYDQGWFLIRASNTQNALSMRVEAQSQESLDDMLSILRKGLVKMGVQIDESFNSLQKAV